MAEVIEFKWDDRESGYWPISADGERDFSGRYVREADYLELQSQRDDALKELEQMHKQYQSIDLMYDDMKTQHDELLEALKEIAEWSEKLNDEVLESHDLAVRQWRGCVAIATAAIRRVEEGR